MGTFFFVPALRGINQHYSRFKSKKMKNAIFSFVLFATCLLSVAGLQAQTQNGNKAYWEQQANLYLQKADRTINYYNQYTRTFSPQELQMMKTNPTQFTQLAQRRTAAYQAALNQYSAQYNQNWVKSFNTFNSQPKVVYYNGQYYLAK